MPTRISPQTFTTLRDTRRLELAMLVCLVLFILFKRSFRDIADIAFGLLVLGTLYDMIRNRWFTIDIYPRLFLISVIPPTASWINSIAFIPDLAQPYPRPFALYTFFIFWFAAYWIRGSERRIFIVLATYCLAILILIFSNSPSIMSELEQGLNGYRVDFGLRNAQHTSLFSTFGCVASIYLGVARINKYEKIHLFQKCLALSLFCIFFALVITTQSRQAWLALTLGAVLAMISLPFLHRKEGQKGLPLGKKQILLLATAILLAGYASLDLVKKRLLDEAEVIRSLEAGSLSSISADSSIGIRIHTWNEAIGWIKERPLLGSGEKIRDDVISRSKTLPEWIKIEFTHLHSSHIETVLSFGVIGGLFIYLIMLYPTIKLLSNREAETRTCWKIFAILTTSIWITINFFESFFFMWDGIYAMTTFLGIIYGFEIKKMKKERDHNLP